MIIIKSRITADKLINAFKGNGLLPAAMKFTVKEKLPAVLVAINKEHLADKYDELNLITEDVKERLVSELGIYNREEFKLISSAK